MSRISFSPDLISTLENRMGRFIPPGLNDDRRVDKGDRPFIAIDPPGAYEVDDAIRVSGSRGQGYMVEVAIADGSQLAGHDNIVTQAIDKRFNDYEATPVVPILPRDVTEHLSLDSSTQRAVVVSRYFSKYLDPSPRVSITPATVKVERTTYGEFGDYCSQDTRIKNQLPALEFHARYRQNRGLSYHSPRLIKSAEGAVSFASKFVETYMVLANIAVAKWCNERSVPILFRNFDEKLIWDEDPDAVSLGTYSILPGIHDGIRRIAAERAAYTHATSPLRRAVDLVNHLQIGSQINGTELPYSAQTLDMLSQHFNNRDKEIADAA